MQHPQSEPAPETARIEPDDRHVTVRFGGETIADSRRAMRVIEGDHPPVFYIPPEDVRTELLVSNGQQTHCPHKGDAHYYDIEVDGRTAEAAAWCYPEPKPGFEAIKSGIAFYPARVDACTVDGQPVSPEADPYYGGWIVEKR
jgi:uncharacterized protein (DUF427 family)